MKRLLTFVALLFLTVCVPSQGFSEDGPTAFTPRLAEFGIELSEAQLAELKKYDETPDDAKSDFAWETYFTDGDNAGTLVPGDYEGEDESDDLNMIIIGGVDEAMGGTVVDQ